MKWEEELEEYCKKNNIDEKKKKELKRKLEELIRRSRFEPGEALGIVTTQSISEPATQMSLDYSEKVILKYKGITKIVPIGEFVDLVISKFGKEEREGWEICNISDKNIYVLSVREDEKIEWRKVENVSRHPSPRTLLKIETLSGRKIIATDSHSFVVRKNNKIVPIAGKDLKVGDRIPSILFLPENCLYSIKTESIIGKQKYVKKPLPEKLELDNALGWIFGAYLAEGNATKFYVSFSNTNPEFLTQIKKFANKYGFTFNEYDNTRGFSFGHDIRINSIQLARLMKKTCNTGAKFKKVPDFAYSANIEFVSGLLRGYFDGDGNVSVERRVIRVSSKSEELIDGIALLLARFKIFARKSKGKEYALSIPYKYVLKFRDNIGFTIKSKAEKLNKLCSLFEQNRNSYQDYVDMIGGFGDILVRISKKLGIASRYVNSFTKRQKIGRVTLSRHIEKFERIAKEKSVDIEKELEILKRMYNSDVVWDEIVKISRVKPSSKYVYDFTVPGTETFTTFDGIITHNTMRTYHYAASAGIQMSLGLPRLIELFDLRKNIEGVSTIYLVENSKEFAEKIASEISESRLENVAETINYDISVSRVEVVLSKKNLEKLNMNAQQVLEIIKKFIKKYPSERKGNRIYFNNINTYAEFRNLKEKLLNLHIKGIKGVKETIILNRDGEWIIQARGGSFKKILLVEGVDARRTTTTNIEEVAEVLGIEAARQALINEIKNTLEEQGINIDERYLGLVADAMCVDGELSSVGRYGIMKKKKSILARLNFEETIKVLFNAAVLNKKDTLNTLMANLMIGKVCPVGTGTVKLRWKL